MAGKPKKKGEPADLVRTPDFKTVYAMGAAGGFTQYDFRVNFYNESYEDDGKRVFFSPLQLIMSPLAAKELSVWLSKQIKDYESKVGKIEAPDISKLSVKKK
jgi:hypothetical protein